MTLLFFCCDDRRRRNEIAQHPAVNGIDFLEVLDAPGQPDAERQRTLFVHFINDPSGLGVTAANVEIAGGERIRDVRVKTAQVAVDARSGSAAPVLVVEVEEPGDFSVYTLRLRPAAGVGLPGLDPVLRAVDFSFKVNCPAPFDPLQRQSCPPRTEEDPGLDYLARDYPSLRQMVLDRLAVLAPDWQERNPADLGMALVELMAYVGDQLSYRQDAIATEAYLGTCRMRSSARRHARLVDYTMHDGCNARAWVQVLLAEGAPPFELTSATFYTALPDLPTSIATGSDAAGKAARSSAIAFELMAPVRLAPEHECIRLYAWGARECCLPQGATAATLRGDLRNLAPGMVLVFEEVRGPRSGAPADADLAHRHAVRLTEVTFGEDPLGRRFDPEPGDGPVAVTEVRWSADDALPFALCVSTEDDDGAYVDDVTVALGNIVLADHGVLVAEEDLPAVPGGAVDQVLPDEPDAAGCREDRVRKAPARHRPWLRSGPVTQAMPLPPDGASARRTLAVDPALAVAQVTLDDGTTEPWTPRADLLTSKPTEKHFAVEVESDGRARLRFGDGVNGLRPARGEVLRASYRVGNGPAGNVGADTLVHVASPEASSIAGARNPLAAVGGTAMETIEEARHAAPYAFRPQDLAGPPARPDGRTLRRAVTPADYAALTETAAGVQRAAATFRWTGSWHTASIAVDRLGGGPLSAAVETELRGHLAPFRLAGHDLEIEPARPVALEITMEVRVKDGYFAADVRRVLQDALSNRRLAGGGRGAFHPDNLTFGQTVYLSPLYAVAQDVEGVESVDVTTFQRRDRPGRQGIDLGRIELARREVARLDNDPNFPERGVLTLIVVGGR